MDGGKMTQADIFIPDTANPRPLRDAMGRFATGVTVVTVAGPDGPMGFAANSFSSVSLDPPLVLWSLARASARFSHFADARHYAIHILHAAQACLIARFLRGGAGFDGLDTPLNDEGVPLITDALARFDCERHATHDGGDHLIIVGRVLRAAVAEGKPLIFSQGQYGQFIAA